MNQVRLFPTFPAVGVLLMMVMLVMSCGDDDSFVRPDSIAPSTPGTPTPTVVSDTQINLAWSASTDNKGGTGGIQGYRVFRNGVFVGTSKTTTYEDKNLTASTEYAYSLQAFDGAGNLSSKTDESAKVTTQAPPPDTAAPSVPSGVAAVETGATKIKVTWTASTDNKGVAKYIIRRDGAIIDSATTGTSFEDATAVAATNYTYTVAAKDAAGNTSAQSSATAAAATGVPGAPGTPTVTGVSGGGVYVSWAAATDNTNGSGIATYDLWRNGQKITNTTGTSHIETGLNADTNYTYAVTANDKSGQTSAQSAGGTGATLNSNSDPITDDTSVLGYSVSSGASVANTGASTLAQGLAINDGAATLAAGITVTGATNIGNATAATVDGDVGSINGDVNGANFDSQTAGGNISGTFTPGAAQFTSAVTVNAAITLDAKGFADALFFIRVDGNADVNENIALANGAKASNVYYSVNGDVTIAAGKKVWGAIVATGTVTLGSGAEVTGRILAGGAVALNNTKVNAP